MEDITIASTGADADAVRAVEEHHAQLAGALTTAVDAVLAAAGLTDAGASSSARSDLVSWARRELVPHALAEESAMYPVAHATTAGRLLVDGMLDEHKAIVRLVDEVELAPGPVGAAAAAYALKTVFDLHLAKENDLVLPLLAADPGVSVTGLLEGMHELLGDGGDSDADQGGDHGHAATAPGGGHSCACGEVDAAGYPELDARAVPHAIRHATIFGALDAVRPGGGLVLVAPHDPLPLLAQVEQRAPGAFAVDYLERGPEAWRLTFVRDGSAAVREAAEG